MGYSSAHQGIWHPDTLPLRMGWQGSGSAADGALGSCGWLDPWAAVPQALVVQAFTEKLPAAAAALQWAMPLYGGCAATASSRGNLAIAQQDQRPQDQLSKPGYLALCTLRAYPLTQYRQLCAALRQRILPLDHPAVQTLVRQALYHCGQLTDSTAAPTLLWRTEWEVPGGVLDTLAAELASLADELSDSPRQHGAVLLLGEMAAYLSAWHTPLRAVARRFAAAAARWAEDLEAEAQEAPPDEARPVRAKQCLLRMTALLCHASGQLSTADVQQLLSLAVLAHHGSIYGKGKDLEAHLERLQVGGCAGLLLTLWFLLRCFLLRGHSCRELPGTLLCLPGPFGWQLEPGQPPTSRRSSPTRSPPPHPSCRCCATGLWRGASMKC